MTAGTAVINQQSHGYVGEEANPNDLVAALKHGRFNATECMGRPDLRWAGSNGNGCGRARGRRKNSACRQARLRVRGEQEESVLAISIGQVGRLSSPRTCSSTARRPAAGHCMKAVLSNDGARSFAAAHRRRSEEKLRRMQKLKRLAAKKPGRPPPPDPCRATNVGREIGK